MLLIFFKKLGLLFVVCCLLFSWVDLFY